MALDVATLPGDPEVLRGMLAQTLMSLEDRDRRIEKLLHEIALLRRYRFGPRSEQLHVDQLLLAFAELSEGQPTVPEPPTEAVAAHERRTKGHGRSPLPDDLPVERVEHVLERGDLGCRDCGEPMQRIADEATRQLEYEPGSFRVIEHVRAKYACRGCADVLVTAPMPPQPIEKGLAGPGLLAHVVVSKYADHLPLHRQEGIFRRHRIELHRSTLCDWVAGCADRLAPLYEALAVDVKRSRTIHTDDTPVPVQDKQKDTTRTGRLWVYVGDAEHEGIVFDYTRDRSRLGPVAFLKGFAGYLQADAYAGYEELYAGGRVIEVGCMAHARRRFFEAKSSDAARSHAGLAFIGKLYEVEHDIRNRSPEDRMRLRRDRAGPMLARFKEWLDLQAPAVLPKSPMGEAIGYARGQWNALTRYLEDPALDIDNNAAERALRCVAIGRKNWLFAGSDEGGRRAAVLFSLIATCKLHGVDPFAYLRDVLRRLPSWGPEPVAALLPQPWQRAHATAAAA